MMTTAPSPTAVAAQGARDATVTVYQRDDYFSPAGLSIPVGTTVRWMNGGYGNHTTTSDTGAWSSGTMAPGATFSYTFNTAGLYRYICQFHREEGMIGQVTVVGTVPGPTPIPSGGNVALGKSVSASSSQAEHPPALAVDGNDATFWKSMPGNPASAQNPQWIYINLGSSYSVSRMHMLWRGGEHARAYSMYLRSATCPSWCLIGSTSSGDGDDTLTLSRPLSAQYFVLQLNVPATPGGAYSLAEWEIFASSSVPPSSANLALGRPARASSQLPIFPAMNVTDGNLATDWRSGTMPAYIFVDFGRNVTVNRAILRWTRTLRATRYSLYAWGNGYWLNVRASGSFAGDVDTLVFPAVSTSALLMNATASASSKVGLREFEVYGSSGIGPYGSSGDDWLVDPPDVPAADAEAQGMAPDAVTEGVLPQIDPEAAPPAELPNLP
jgi:plastocyanin